MPFSNKEQFLLFITSKTTLSTLTLIVLVVLFILRKPPEEKVEEGQILAKYTCDAGVYVKVIYDNRDATVLKAIVTTPDMKNVIMDQVVSASGARYSNGSYVWWSKGDTGSLTTADPENKSLIANCVSY